MSNKKLAYAMVLAVCLSAAGGDVALAGKKVKLVSLPPDNDYPPRTVAIGSDRGGAVIQYGLRMLRWRQNRTRIRFSGACQSACTLYLGLAPSQVCISPGASFSFHAPHGSSRRGNQGAQAYMMRNYPGWVRSWIRSQGGLSGRMKTMSYGYASRFINPCGSSAVVGRGASRRLPAGG